MRLLLTGLAVLAATAPAASACTLDNCVEVRHASATWIGTDLHDLTGTCAVTGRAGVRFSVTGEAHAHGDSTVPESITVQCTAYRGSTPVFDSSVSDSGPVAVLSGGFVSGPDVRVCVTASATFPDGHTVGVADCS